MSQLDDLFNERNVMLFDMLFRHQVYLEGWKTHVRSQYVAYLDKLYAEFGKYLRQTRYTQLDQFTKAQLLDFISRFKIAQTRFYSSFTEQLINELQQFAVIDTDLAKQIVARVDGADIQTANSNANETHGPAAIATDSEDVLWGHIKNAPIPANGMLLLNMLSSFGMASALRIAQTITQGYASSWSISKLESALFGVGNDYSGGLLGTLLNQQRAVVNTAIQHVSSETQSAVFSSTFERYQHVSIIDSHTTPECVDLDGQIFVYGFGPLVPIHYGCRSKDVPLASPEHEHDADVTYADWIATQSTWFVDDAFTNPATDTDISTTKPLTLAGFSGKVKYILGDVTDAL